MIIRILPKGTWHLLKEIVSTFEMRGSNLPFRFDKRVSFSIIGETVDVAAQYSGKMHVNPNKSISDNLFLKRGVWDGSKSILEVLIYDLNIDRIITLNYDLEAELEYCHRSSPQENGTSVFQALGAIERDPATGILIKRLPGARSMASDVFNRERTDRLIEFAVGSADHEYHVLHLHGRADAFDTMVVSYRDYDRLYRRSGLSKAPFEHALKLLFVGNPILFVGIGMNEAEVNRTLQDYVGNHPYRRIMPTFLLWNSFHVGQKAANEADLPRTSVTETQEIDQEACDIFRIDMLHRLGILTIFSHELAEAIVSPAASHLGGAETLKCSELRDSIENLAKNLQEIRSVRLAKIESWRSMRSRVQHKGLIGAWEVSAELAGDKIRPEIELGSLVGRLSVAVGRSGVGKGALARAVANAWLEQNNDGTLLLLNADYCFDTDSLLNLVGDFLKHRKREKIRREYLPERDIQGAWGVQYRGARSDRFYRYRAIVRHQRRAVER